MKKPLTGLFLLATSSLLYAATNRITLTITVTNAANCTNGTLLVISGTSRMATNTAYTSTTWQTNVNEQGLKTNLFMHLAANGIGVPRLALIDIGPTNFALRGAVDQAVTVTSPDNWAIFSLSTQTVVKARDVRVPLSEEYPTNAQYIASQLIEGLSTYGTNWFNSNCVALVEYLTRGTNVQTKLGKVSFWAIGTSTNVATIYGGTNWGTRVRWATNDTSTGTFTNVIVHTLTITNGANYGTPFRSPGTADYSEQFGTSAAATKDSALAVGNGAAAGGTNSIAIGTDAAASGFNSVGVGNETTASGIDSVAVGRLSVASASNSFAIGTGVQSAVADQGIIGSSAHTVKIAGILSVAVQTNSTFKGTNTLVNDYAETITAISSLADGNNLLDPSNYVTIRLDAGPTAAYSIHGVGVPRAGRVLTIINNCAAVLTLANESGVETTAANRIKTFNAADQTVTTNGVAQLQYDSGSSRWRIRYIYP